MPIATQLARTNLSRLSIGVTRPDGTRVTHRFQNMDGILQPVEPDGTDSIPNEPAPPAPPTLRLDAVLAVDFAHLVSAALSAARSLDRFLQLNDPTGADVKALERLRTALTPFEPDRSQTRPLAEVAPMNLSALALKLVTQYLDRIADEEHPAEGIQKGFTPRELGIRRKVAHDKLMAQLRAEGIQFSDRSAVTEFAKRCDQWLRE